MAVSVKEEPLSPIPCGVSRQTGNENRSAGLSLPQQVAEFQMTSPPVKRAKYKPQDAPNLDQTKHRLKNAVIGRRRARGESDMDILFEEPRECPLTSLDIERREKRKEQNRRAAKKCRFKKRELETAAAEETARVDQENKQMQVTITHYQVMIRYLTNILYQHLICGDCKLDQALRDQHFCHLTNQTHHQLPPITITNVVQAHQKPHHQVPHVTTNVVPTHQVPHITTNVAPTHQEPHHGSLIGSPELRSTYTPPIIGDIVSGVPYESEGNLRSLDFLAGLIPQEVLDDLENIESQTTKMSTEEISYSDCLNGCQRQITYSEKIHYGDCLAGCQTPSSDIPAEILCSSFASQGSNNNRLYYPGEGQDTGQPDTPVDDLSFCVSPNAVQPNLIQLHPVARVTSRTTALTSVTPNNYNNVCVTEGHMLKYSTDINNNIGSETSIVINRNSNAQMPQSESQIQRMTSLIPLNGCGYTQSNVSAYFTFDSRSQSPEVAQGTEPISPFYTQGGDRRL